MRRIIFDKHWQWIGLYASREALIERRTHPYNKLAIIAFALSILPVLGISLVSLSLALLIGAMGSVLGLISLFQIKDTKERGYGLALMAVVMRLMLKIIVVIVMLLR